MILLLGLLLNSIVIDAQSVSGSLVDEKGNPVSFANVVLLSSKDSSFVQGTISNEQGIFSIDQTSGNNILKNFLSWLCLRQKPMPQFPVTIVCMKMLSVGSRGKGIARHINLLLKVCRPMCARNST